MDPGARGRDGLRPLAVLRPSAVALGAALAPPDAPRTLVVQGLYGYVRNPMCLSVTPILLGKALLAWSLALLIYWALWFAGVNLFVRWCEGPTLRRRFGEECGRNCTRVHRWLPRPRGD